MKERMSGSRSALCRVPAKWYATNAAGVASSVGGMRTLSSGSRPGRHPSAAVASGLVTRLYVAQVPPMSNSDNIWSHVRATMHCAEYPRITWPASRGEALWGCGCGLHFPRFAPGRCAILDATSVFMSAPTRGHIIRMHQGGRTIISGWAKWPSVTACHTPLGHPGHTRVNKSCFMRD